MQLDVDRGLSRWFGARSRGGKNCQHEAGWGSDHPGWARCELHAGMAPSGRAAAVREQALAEMPVLGGDLEIEPADGPLACIGREAGKIVWLRASIEAVGHGEEHYGDRGAYGGPDRTSGGRAAGTAGPSPKGGISSMSTAHVKAVPEAWRQVFDSV